MKYFALAMMAVLAMASVSMAGQTVDIRPGIFFTVSDPVDLDDPNDVLEAYTVSCTGLKSFYNISFDVPVHNTNFNLGGPALATPFAASAGANAAFDTHFLFAEANVVKTPGFGSFADTNDWTNPGGISAGLLAGAQAGMGNMTSNPTGEGFAFAAALDGTPFMQVVKLKSVPLVKLLMVSPIQGADVGYEVPIGIPEPGTIVMLIAGALCVLGIRRK